MAFTRWETTTSTKGGQQQGGQRQGGQQQGGQTSVQPSDLQQATPAVQQQATGSRNVMFCHATPATRYPVHIGRQCGPKKCPTNTGSPTTF